MSNQRFDLIDALAAMLAERGKITSVRLVNDPCPPIRWDEFMLTGRLDEIPEDLLRPAEIGRECPTCFGSGTVGGRWEGGKYTSYEEERPCPDCEKGLVWSREY